MLTRLRRAVSRTRHHDPLVADLQDAIGADRVRDDAAERALLRRDASVFDGGVAGPICFPTSTAEVQAIMRIAERHGRAIVPRGAGTGLSGGAIPLGAPIVVAVTKMNRILEVDVENRVAWVEPGVINLDLTSPPPPHGLPLRPRPVEPAGLHHRRQRGQQLRRAALPRLRRHRRPRPRGRGASSPTARWSCSAASTAEPAGLDLPGLFVGSEGTLGIATAIAVRLTPNPPAVRTLLLVVRQRRRRGRAPSATSSPPASCPPRSR